MHQTTAATNASVRRGFLTTWTIVLCLGAPAIAGAAASSGRGTGFYGDGNGFYPDYRGPTEFDGASGRNIVWKAKTLNWSNASPIVVGDKLFYLNEPVDWRPILVCLDATTGEERWRREIDVIQALDAEDRQRFAEHIPMAWQWFHDRMRLENRQRIAKALDQDTAAIEQEMLAFGWFRHPKRGDLRLKDPPWLKPLEHAGLGLQNWTWKGTWVGIAYGTPASDGQRVFVQTAHNLFLAFDLDGKLLWQRRFASFHNKTRRQMVSEVPVLQGLKHWSGNVQGAGNYSTSPIVCDGVLLSCGGRMMRGFDPASGDLLWEHPQRSAIGQGMGVPNTVVLGGRSYVIAPGRSDRGVEIRRVADGTLMGWVPGVSAGKGNLFGALVAGDLVVTGGKGLLIHRLALAEDGGSITCTPVATTDDGNRRSVVADGRIFYRDRIFDLATGALLADKLPANHAHAYWLSGVVLGPSYVSINHADGSFIFRDRDSGQEVGRGQLPWYVEDGVPRELRLACNRFSGTTGYHGRKADKHAIHERLEWMITGAAFPAATRDRLYLRSFDYVWCIGR